MGFNGSYEQDRIQCQEVTDQKKRCERIGTVSCGGKVRCGGHHQMYLVKRANDVPVKKEVK